MKHRFEYIDAARGLAIFTVVYSHIALFCTHGYESSGIINFLRIYFLNAFFFISGFVAVSSKKFSFIPELKKKLVQLLIPTILVSLIFAFSYRIPLNKLLFDSAKYGYWFTFVLFEMYLILLIVKLIGDRFGNKYSQILLFIVSILLYLLHKTQIGSSQWGGLFSIGNLSYYFIYFVVGYILRCNMLRIIKLSNWISPMITILAILILTSDILPIPTIIYNFSVLGCVIYILHKSFSTENIVHFITPVKRFLLILGKYTLEIYFIHYFLLFPLPESINSYLITLSNSVRSLSFPEFMIIGTIVVFTCISCIVISYFIKQIPYFAILFFGKSMVSK